MGQDEGSYEGRCEGWRDGRDDGFGVSDKVVNVSNTCFIESCFIESCFIESPLPLDEYSEETTPGTVSITVALDSKSNSKKVTVQSYLI